jgi:uncharacterized cupin superfamily protein/quinol monooxygenase YgiN
MPGVGRFVKLTAREGQGDALAAKLLEVAESLRTVAGCELYLINRTASEPDIVCVNELWLSQEALDASLATLQTDQGKTLAQEVISLLDGPPERIDVLPVGGVGYLAGGSGATIVNLEEIEDQAPKFGMDQVMEARFGQRDLGACRTGISHQRLRPGVRQPFGHHHQHAEEVFVVLAGSGRVKIDEDIRELRQYDAIRVAPESSRAFEAGPDGLELLAVGPHHAGDAVIVPDFWDS